MKKIILIAFVLMFLISCRNTIKVIKHLNPKYGTNEETYTLSKFKSKNNEIIIIKNDLLIQEFHKIKNKISTEGQEEILDNSIYNYCFVFKNDSLYTNRLKPTDTIEDNHYVKTWKYNGKTLRYSSNVFTNNLLNR